jgi:hypothetical protein
MQPMVHDVAFAGAKNHGPMALYKDSKAGSSRTGRWLSVGNQSQAYDGEEIYQILSPRTWPYV